MILNKAFDCSFVWAGESDEEKCLLSPLAASPPDTFERYIILKHLKENYSAHLRKKARSIQERAFFTTNL